jgi:serine/threonine protein kinase
VPLPSENEFRKWDKQVHDLGDFETVFLPTSRRFEKTEFCGSGGIAFIQYKFYPYLLSDEVINRCNMEGKHFEEAELWYLIYAVIGAAASFHAKGVKLGDVRPQNVFISPEGQVRVATQLTWPNESTNYHKAVYEREITYLSPEELKDINYGKLDEGSNSLLSEAFSVGLTCLDAATLTDSSKLYEPGNKFSYSRLEERIHALESSRNYSEPLVLLIKGLCQVESDRRISCRELENWLRVYENEIIDLQDFQVKELPDKLRDLRVASQPTPTYQQQPASFQPQPNAYQAPPQVNPQMQPIRDVWQQKPQPVITQQTYLPQGQGQVYPQGQFQPQPYYQQTYQPVPQQTYVSYQTPGQPGYEYAQGQSQANQNPSAMTFQREQARSGLESGLVSQPSQNRNVNLQQIDEQLQKSRKLFPSS